MKYIYPDTNIWNLLFDQQVDPRVLRSRLESHGFTLVLSSHAVYEIARNFARGDRKGHDRGTQLFGYLLQHLGLGMACSKELWEYLLAEAFAFTNRLGEIDTLATTEQCQTVRIEVEKLADGTVEGRVKLFLEQRRQWARDTKVRQEEHIIERKKLREYLLSIQEEGLAAWMESETLTHSGVSILRRRFLKKCIGPGPALKDVHSLLCFPPAEAARATVRADLYANWHCAWYKSNRLDLMDDMLHVLQAVYSDLYVTEDRKQTQFASLLLTSKTRVAIYSRAVPIDEWLLALIRGFG